MEENLYLKPINLEDCEKEYEALQKIPAGENGFQNKYASTINLDIPELIELANIAETSQRENSTDFFETIYNMKELFDVECSEVSIEMLDKITHIPAILIKKDNYL